MHPLRPQPALRRRLRLSVKRSDFVEQCQIRNPEPRQFVTFKRFLANLSANAQNSRGFDRRQIFLTRKGRLTLLANNDILPRFKIPGPAGVSPDSVTSGFMVTCCVSNRGFVLRHSHNCSVRAPKLGCSLRHAAADHRRSAMAEIVVKEILEAGVHYGHRSSRWKDRKSVV